ncbi:MAG: hypothetical protein KDK54_15590 [Leptospiraceae bacterium]|nr:hypothetical protein [Leptospiraceae bacterium]
MRVCFFLFLFLSTGFLEVSLRANPVSYEEIDPILTETWNATYPVAFTSIKKKDVLGKGIMVLRENGNLIYLYTFFVSFPRYHQEEGKLIADEENSKEILVKLYHRPYHKEKSYSIDLGEFSEKYNLRSVVRWIK